MPKFRKFPIVIEAFQWFPLMGEIGGVERKGKPSRNLEEPAVYGIKTLEGFMEVKPGSWVITGVAGETYPCEDQIFRASYEAVDQ